MPNRDELVKELLTDADAIESFGISNGPFKQVANRIRRAAEALSATTGGEDEIEAVARAIHDVDYPSDQFPTSPDDEWRNNLMDQARAAIGVMHHLAPTAGWRDIESAPRGKALLVYKSNTKEQYVAARVRLRNALSDAIPLDSEDARFDKIVEAIEDLIDLKFERLENRPAAR